MNSGQRNPSGWLCSVFALILVVSPLVRQVISEDGSVLAMARIMISVSFIYSSDILC